jgi:hypothetical protein
MCGLCGILAGREHWADVAAADPDYRLNRRRERFARVRLLNEVLGHFGLRLADWQGASFLLTGRTGRTEIVGDLSTLWPTAARMIGRRLDPLEPALVAALERAGSSGARGPDD